MQVRDVIALEEGIDGEFPVDARRHAIDREQRISLKLQRREILRHRTKLGIGIKAAELAFVHRLWPHEQHAVTFGALQAHQAVVRELDAGETDLVGCP